MWKNLNKFYLQVSSLEESQSSIVPPIEVPPIDNSVDELKLENTNLAEKLRHYQEVLGTTVSYLCDVEYSTVYFESFIWYYAFVLAGELICSPFMP